MVGVVLPSPDSDETESEFMQRWSISRSELSAYLLFFDHFGYFSGFRPPAVGIRVGEQFLLTPPHDPALQQNLFLLPFYSPNPQETIAEAMVAKIAEGFNFAPGEVWVYHPRYFQTNAATRSGKTFTPSIGISLLDGLWCPADDVQIDEVLRFKEERDAERQAFMAALLEASENVQVQNHGLVLGVSIEKVERALAELNRTAIERWASGAKRSFRWGIRPNQTTLRNLAGAIAAYDCLGNTTVSVLLALSGAVEFSIDLTPRLEPISATARAFSYMMDVQKTFVNPEAYTRHRLRSVGKKA
jgi:hypothetical protein